MNKPNLKKMLVLALTGVMLVMSAGCDSKTDNGKPAPSATESTSKPSKDNTDKPAAPAASDSSSKKQEQAKTLSIEVYYPDDNGMKLVPVKREIEVNPYKDKYTAAVEMQMRAPKEKNLTDVFPQGVKLLSVKVEGETAIVDFEGRLSKGFVGGSTGEEMLVGSVVNTLTNYPEIKEVRFMLDGKPIETIAGHMDLSRPVKRMDGLLK